MFVKKWLILVGKFELNESACIVCVRASQSVLSSPWNALSVSE